jgi:hypothetical protein
MTTTTHPQTDTPKKTVYKVEYDWWEAKISIKESEKTIQAMRDSLMFFSNGETVIKAAEGDIAAAWLKYFAPAIIHIASKGYGKDHIIQEFGEEEGYLPLDGSEGVQLLEADDWVFIEDQFTITRMQ